MDRVLGRLHPERSAALIFSDAGAARGDLELERVRTTVAFLDALRARVRNVAWLNPMPRVRWDGTTAGEVAQLVPMFELSRRGLYGAIGVLRGRLVSPAEPWPRSRTASGRPPR